MKVVIMAGGKGTRIQSVASDIPKPMLTIDGTPVLEREIRSLVQQGFKDIIITTGHLGHVIQKYFGDGSAFGAKITYFHEKQPLGNAGALFKLKRYLTEPFLLINGDIIFDVDFKRMINFHYKKNGLVTLFTHPNDHPYDSCLLVVADDLSVKKWLMKDEQRPIYYKNIVNAGIHIIDPKVLEMIDTQDKKDKATNQDDYTKIDLDKQILCPLAGRHLMFCYQSPEYVKDMGTPERLRRVKKDYKAGLISARNLSNRQKAIFLDRDGTINVYKNFLNKIDDFELIPDVAENIAHINQSEFLCIVVTNQPVIARGELTIKGLEAMHDKMETLLGREGAYIDGLYYCPHHPDKGYSGEIIKFKKNCQCRKPKPGMLLQAAKDFNIDLQQSWMIGDSKNDIQAGKAAGCYTALICQHPVDYGQDIVGSKLGDCLDSIKI